MFSLTKVRDKVYALKFDDQYELCMTFMRYEEFYESPNLRFQGHPFTWVDFMAWYSKEFGEGNFTYATDWAGFNMPANIIKHVHDLGIIDPNRYDAFMSFIYSMIESDSYIIGYVEGDVSLMQHELTHAMYCLDEEYRQKVAIKLARAGESLVARLKQALYDEGYAPVTVVDEIQAYITTGEAEMFDDITENDLLLNLNILRFELKKLHQEHFSRFLPGSAGNVGSNPTQDAKAESGDV